MNAAGPIPAFGIAPVKLIKSTDSLIDGQMTLFAVGVSPPEYSVRPV